MDENGEAVICDFGLAKAGEANNSGLTTTGFNENGSRPYMAPELLQDETAVRTPETDVWAWGCVLNEVSGPVSFFRRCLTPPTSSYRL